MKHYYLVRLSLFLIVSAVIFTACTYPFSTASGSWRIRYDEAKIAYKKWFLSENQSDHLIDQPPNIVLIVVDDLGKAEVSAYGSKTMNTPNIDRIAKDGVLFENCYVTSPVCSPSRAGMLTGRYPVRYGFETQPVEMYPNNLLVYTSGKYFMNTDKYVLNTRAKYPPEWELQKQGIPPSEINLAELLKTKDYNTACIGKWHLGYSKDHIPNVRGFDYHYGFYGAFTVYSKEKNTDEIASYIHDQFGIKYQWKQGRKGQSAIRRNNKKIREKRYLTQAFTDEAIKYLNEIKDNENPFFLYLAYNAPHVPFQAPRRYYDLYDTIKDDNVRTYRAMIHALDDEIGRFLNQLEEMKLDENTIIFFISDNGAAHYTGATDNYPYKGGKLTWFEGGLNVSFAMKWKGRIPEGIQYEKAVSGMDIFNTCAAITGCPLPDDRIYDGVNLIPFVTGEKTGAPHDALYWKADHIQAMHNGKYKMMRSSRDGWTEIYHIRNDRFEKIDLSEEMPDTIQQMQNDFDHWKKDLPDPLWPRLMDVEYTTNGKTYLFPS